jgi:hypothetical protein
MKRLTFVWLRLGSSELPRWFSETMDVFILTLQRRPTTWKDEKSCETMLNYRIDFKLLPNRYAWLHAFRHWIKLCGPTPLQTKAKPPTSRMVARTTLVMERICS